MANNPLEKEAIAELLRVQFPALSDSHLREEIARVASIQRFPAGKEIMDYGSYIRMVPMLISGRIKVLREDEQGREILLYFLDPGQTCTMSFSCCLGNKQSEVRTVADEDTELIGIPVDAVDRWMTKYPVWKNFVMRSYDDRMMELIHTIDNIAFKKMDERLWDYLELQAARTGDGMVRLTHQQIARDLFASREAISRLLKKLEQEGRIALGRNEIILNRKTSTTHTRS